MKKLIPKIIGAGLNMLSLVAPRNAGEKAFLLFCRPFRSKLTDKHREFLNQADRFSFVHDDVNIQGYRWGNGEKKVVFLHGWQSHSYRWKAYVDALSKQDYTIYAIDAPGHGFSSGNFLTVPVYASVIKTLLNDLGDVHAVVGHSIGSFSLMYAFHESPLLSVKKVILMAPPGEASEFVDVFKSTLGASNRLIDLIVDQFRDRYNVTPQFFSARVFAERMHAAGLIIHDKDDAEAPLHHAEEIHKRWKRSQLITTEGYGHNLRHPSVVEALVGFIASEKNVFVEV